MRVLMFGWEFPPHNSGGLGVACKGLAYGLVKKGIDVCFVLPRKIPIGEESLSISFAEEIGGISVRYIQSLIPSPYDTQPIPGSPFYDSFRHLGKGSYYYNLLSEVLQYEKNASKVAMSEKFDVIHAHDWLSFKAGIAAKEVSGKPLVAHIHATEFDRSGEHINPMIYEIEKEGFQKADKIIAVSNFTRNIVINRYGIDASKVSVAYNGVDLDEIQGEQAAKVDVLRISKDLGYNIVLFLGRLTYQKNPDILLRAAKEILAHNPKTLFVYGGSGDMEQYLMETAAHLGISDKVIFAGFVRGTDKQNLFRIADVFVMPSISEPFGIVPLESLANNTPVIISKQSGISEILMNSLKVDFWDIDEITNKVVAVLKHKALKEELGTNGNHEVLKFTWDSAADSIRSVYDSLI